MTINTMHDTIWYNLIQFCKHVQTCLKMMQFDMILQTCLDLPETIKCWNYLRNTLEFEKMAEKMLMTKLFLAIDWYVIMLWYDLIQF